MLFVTQYQLSFIKEIAKYLHKNTHDYDTIDPKRTIKMSSKVL